MSYAIRSNQHSNTPVKEQQQPGHSFFNRGGHTVQTKKDSFFQAKLTVGAPDDQYEREADSVADNVVNHQPGSTPVVQQKKISGVQRLATSKEDEKLGTDEERMRRDKEIQTKPEIQRVCAECEKEKKGIQREADPEKEKEKKKPGNVQTKPDGGGIASSRVTSRIEASAGNGQPIAGSALNKMESSFGRDFSHVNIHTGQDAASMNKELGAQAFTHGSDIYFNNGKYDPESNEGQRLLAHELTHVVQQNAG